MLYIFIHVSINLISQSFVKKLQNMEANMRV